jgi:hypothetical protein
MALLAGFISGGGDVVNPAGRRRRGLGWNQCDDARQEVAESTGTELVAAAVARQL